MKKYTQINGRSRKTGFIFALAAVLLIIVVLGFTGGINIGSFQQKYEESIVFSLVVPSKQTISKIEYAVKYGKELQNFYGMKETLQDLLIQLPDVHKAQISLPDGTIRFNQEGHIQEAQIADHFLADIANAFDTRSSEPERTNVSSPSEYVLFLENDTYGLFLPIYSPSYEWIGSLSLHFDREVVSSRTWQYLLQLVAYLLILAVVATAVLFVFAFFFPFLDQEGKLKRKQTFLFIVIILSSIQIVYGLLNYNLFSKAYIQASKEVAVSTVEMINRDVKSVVEKGVTYTQFKQFDTYLQKVIRALPVVEHISLIGGADLFLSSQNQLRLDVLQLDSEYSYQIRLASDGSGMEPIVHVQLSESYIKSQLRTIILDTLTVLVTSILFMVEVSILVILFLGRRIVIKSRQMETGSAAAANRISSSEVELNNAELPQDIALVRPLSFVFHMALFFSAAFIPIMSKELYQPFLGLSETIIIALPVSIEMLGAGLGVIIAGSLVDKKGWKPLFLTGAVSVGIGMYMCSLEANTILSFSIARGLAGFGYGTCFMALRGLISSAPTEGQKTEGLTSFFVGLYAGINCGIIVGAMLADRIGFYNVFTLGLVIVCLTSLVVVFYMKNSVSHPSEALRRRTVQGSFNQLLRFIKNRQVLTFLFLIALPVAACNMFLDYYFPIFADQAGISTSDVGRAFLVNGLIIVYLAPLLSRYCLKWFGVEKSLLYSGLLIALAMLVFGFHSSLLTAFIAVILLGISDSFGLVAQNKYYINLRATGDLGIGKALGYYDNIRKVGQMVGPMIFGGLVMFGHIGISLLGLLFVAMLFIFWFMRVKNSAIAQQEE